MALFPPTGVKEDSALFDDSFEDKGLKSETDGGYVYSRPRHGRRARRMFSTGFTDISSEQKELVMQFALQHGTYLAFTYNIPDSAETVSVRFSKLPKAVYIGVGGNHRYNIADIELTEV